MPQLQNLVVTDRATPTPVDHTLVPRDISTNGVGTVVENTSVPVGQLTLDVSMRKAGSAYRGRLTMKQPITQDVVVGGVTKPTVVRSAFAAVDFVFDETSTEAERNNLVGMLASALGTSKVLVNDTIVKLQGVY